MSKLHGQVSSFFRRVGQYLRRGSEVAGSWIDEQAAITQRIRAIRHLRSEQQKVLTTIGGKVYALHRRGKVRNRDVLAECQRIDEILAHIARLRNEIEQIKRKSTRPGIQLMEVEDDTDLAEPDETQVEGGEQQAEITPASSVEGESASEKQLAEAGNGAAEGVAKEEATPRGKCTPEPDENLSSEAHQAEDAENPHVEPANEEPE
jgi:hypothetical protein